MKTSRGFTFWGTTSASPALPRPPPAATAAALPQWLPLRLPASLLLHLRLWPLAPEKEGTFQAPRSYLLYFQSRLSDILTFHGTISLGHHLTCYFSCHYALPSTLLTAWQVLSSIFHSLFSFFTLRHALVSFFFFCLALYLLKIHLQIKL